MGRGVEGGGTSPEPEKAGAGPGGEHVTRSPGDRFTAGNSLVLTLACKGGPTSLGCCHDPEQLPVVFPQQNTVASNHKLVEVLCQAVKPSFNKTQDQCYIEMAPGSLPRKWTSNTLPSSVS